MFVNVAVIYIRINRIFFSICTEEEGGHLQKLVNRVKNFTKLEIIMVLWRWIWICIVCSGLSVPFLLVISAVTNSIDQNLYRF